VHLPALSPLFFFFVVALPTIDQTKHKVGVHNENGKENIYVVLQDEEGEKKKK